MKTLRSLALFLVLATLLPVGPSSFASSATTSQVCESALSKIQSSLTDYPQESKLDNSYEGYKTRLPRFLNTVSAEKFNNIFTQIGSVEIKDLYWLSKVGRLEAGSSQILSSHPGLHQFIIDIYRFNQDHGGVLWERSTNAFEETKALLNAPQSSASDTASFKNYTASKFSDSISKTLTSLLERAIGEYRGENFDRSLGRRIADRVKRFVFPLYKRVDALIYHGQINQTQLGLIGVVDGIIDSRGLQREQSLALTRDESSALQVYISDTPEQIRSVQEELVRVYGRLIHSAGGVPLNEIQIYTAYGNIKKTNLDKMDDDYHREAEQALDTLDTSVSAAQIRLGRGARQMSDRLDEEVKIRFSQYVRQTTELLNIYSGITNETSNVSYTVEDRHYRTVSDGTDEKGNPKTRQEEYFISRTVRPTYQDIITQTFDTGDRYVSGLSEIRDATKSLSDKERVYIRAVEAAYDFTKKSKEKVKEHLAALKRLEPGLHEYSLWSESQIRNQWRNDSADNFQRRNGVLYKRLQNAILLLTYTQESLDRNLKTMEFSVQTDNFEDALGLLRRHMYFNYGIKFTGTSLGAGGAYIYIEQPELTDASIQWVMTNLNALASLMTPFLQFFN